MPEHDSGPRRGLRLLAIAWLISLTLHGIGAGILCWGGRGARFAPTAASVDTRAAESYTALTVTLYDLPTPNPPAPAPAPAVAPAPVLPSVIGRPPPLAPPAPGSPAAPGSPTTDSAGWPPPAADCRTVVYVLDRSASMGLASRLANARRALLAHLARLPATVRFQVIAYNRRAQVLSATAAWLSPTERDMRALESALEALEAEGGSEHLPALRQALALGPDVIYWLTDAGGLSPADLRGAVARGGDQTRVVPVVFAADGSQPAAALFHD